MAYIRRHDNFLILFDDTNKVIQSEQIPFSGKTLIQEVKLQNVARDMGLKIKFALNK